MHAYNADRRSLKLIQNLRIEPHRQYPDARSRNMAFLAAPQQTRFSITRASRIASIGSCFAREIKYWLKDRGFNFIEKAVGPCADAGSARYDRVYNTFSIRQEFDRAFAEFNPIERIWRFEDRGRAVLMDPYRKNLAWDSLEECEQELEQHRRDVQAAFTEADALIMTVGQNEIWYDRRDGSVFPLIPPGQVYDAAIHAHRPGTYEENLDNLTRAYELWTRHNEQGFLIVTVSPVPLRVTFREETNAVVANVAQKSILRAAVEAFVARHADRVSYFPAYEICTAVERDAFEDDNRHVRKETVDRIMRHFESQYVK